MKKIIFILTIFALFCPYGILYGQAKYNLPCRIDLLRVSDSVAHAQVGTREATNHNDGAVQKYKVPFGLQNTALPYCAMGVYYCFYTASKTLNIPLKNIPIKKTALANGIFSDAKNRGVRMLYKPAKHDLLVWNIGGTSKGHIERVDSVGKAGWVRCIGFNTGDGGGHDGVNFTKRNIYYVLNRMYVRGLVGFNYEV